MTALRQVLNAFEESQGAVSLREMAHRLDISPAMLEQMVDYWVRKGKLREVGFTGGDCSACGHASGCPFVVRMPRTYELARQSADNLPVAACSCGTCHNP